jgi:hypothetical protein
MAHHATPYPIKGRWSVIMPGAKFFPAIFALLLSILAAPENSGAQDNAPVTLIANIGGAAEVNRAIFSGRIVGGDA